VWTEIITTGMCQQFNWEASAQQYIALYQAAIEARRSIEMRL
jgi:starch synthase